MTIINNTGYSSLKVFCESDSADVSLSSSRKIWSLQKPKVIPPTSGVQMLCSVESCSIPLSYYTVNPSNNKFKVRSGTTGDYTIFTVEPGNYTAKTIIKAIVENESVPNESVPFKMEFNTALSVFKLAPKVYGTFIDFAPCADQIYKLIGLDLNDSVPFNEDYYTTHVVNLVYTSGIYIAINNIGNSNIDTGIANQNSNCLIRIPITQPSNTVLQFFNNVGFKNLMSAKVLNQIDMSLLDDNRRPLVFTSNVDWTVVLRIDFQKVIVETVEKTRLQLIKDGAL